MSQIDPTILAYGVVTADEVGVGRALIKTDRNNFAPRLGRAWRLTENTVLRGGYGMFYPTAAAQQMRDALTTNPFNQGRTKDSRVTPLSGWPGFTHGFSPFSNGTLRTIGSQPSANAVPLDLQQPRIEQFNVTFERELRWKTALRVSYLGTRSHGLISGFDLNLIPPNDKPLGTTTGDGVTPCSPADGDCDLSPADLARLPYPGWAISCLLMAILDMGGQTPSRSKSTGDSPAASCSTQATRCSIRNRPCRTRATRASAGLLTTSSCRKTILARTDSSPGIASLLMECGMFPLGRAADSDPRCRRL